MPDNVQEPKIVDTCLFIDDRFDRKDFLNNLKQVFSLFVIEPFIFSWDRRDDLEINYNLACVLKTNRYFTGQEKKPT